MLPTLNPRILIPSPSRIYTDNDLRNRLWHLHGILLCLAFLLLFPLGIFAIRSGSRHAFRYHWLLQTSGTVLALTGIAVGILTSKGMVVLHQYAGIALGIVLLIQPLSGWKHHVVFMQTKSRSWISFGHMWIGGISIIASWINILLGLNMRQYGFLVKSGTGVAILCFLVLWGLRIAGIFTKRSTVRMERTDEREDRQGLMTGVGNEFALDDFDEEDEDDNEEGHRLKP